MRMVPFHFLSLLFLDYLFIQVHSFANQPVHYDPRLLARQIKSSDVEKAVKLVQLAPQSSAAPYIEALYVCGKARRPDLAMQVYSKNPTERIRSVTISVLSKCGKHKEAVALLADGPSPDRASYNSAIAACGRDGAWEESIDILSRMPIELISQLTCHAALTTFAKAGRGVDALKLLRQMEPNWNMTPDKLSYRLTIQALIREGNLDDARGLLDECTDQQSMEMMAAAYGRVGKWSAVREIELRGGGDGPDNAFDTNPFRHWETLKRVGQGKASYWELGTYKSQSHTVSVGFQPNRNPRKNGIRLVLVDPNGSKLGFLLMTNWCGQKKQGIDHSASSLMGLRVEESERTKGWGKILLAVWIQCCLEARIAPITGRINKPIIALMLQHNFGFHGTGGVVCEAARQDGRGDRVKLFSNSVKSLEGAFSPWDLQSQRIVLSNEPVGGRTIRVGATWEAPADPESLRPKVQQVLQDRMVHDVTPSDLRTIMLGTSDTASP